jgi:DNA-directed RNA polymerase specialized sigma24 family protein
VTAKEFLRRAREVDRRVDEAQERVERIRAKLESGRMSSLTGMPRGGGADWTETADKLIELERVVNARTRELVRWKLAAIDAIRSVEEPRLSEVLELYYIDGLKWEDVAQRMGLDVRWVYRLHGRALLCVKVPEGVCGDGTE